MNLAQVMAIINLLLAFNTPQPIVTNVQTILIASIPAGVPSVGGAGTILPPGGQASLDTSPTPSPSAIIKTMKIYQLSYEASQGTFYYAGDKPLQSAKVQDSDAVIGKGGHSTDCYMVDGTKICGYYYSRFTAQRGGDNDTIELTADDGSTYSGTATTIN